VSRDRRSIRAGKVGLALAVCAVVAGALPAAATASSISGHVTDGVSHLPIAGVDVCSHVSPYTFEDTCDETSASGAYLLNGLPAGSYHVHFSADRNNLDYVNEFYDDEESFPGDLIAIADGEARTETDAELHAGGVIAGTVTDAVSLLPVAGFPVCAFAQTATGEVGRCARTGSGGDYAIRGLPTEEYEVEFLGGGEFNYLTQYWEATETYGDDDPVPVTVGGTVAGIDAALNRGAVIAGTLSETGTHAPVAEVSVSLHDPISEELLEWETTDSAGHYAFRGLPAGTYVVAFSRPLYQWDGDGYSTQYYNGASAFSAATPLTVAPPEELAGIDGEVVNEFPPAPFDPYIKPEPPPVPIARITATPKKTVRTRAKRAAVRFSFSASDAGARFECRLDKRPFAVCGSPARYAVRPGSHTFRVRGVNTTGEGPVASASFAVRKIRRPAA
jgi:Carboxypeptidase regulatory-like domain